MKYEPISILTRLDAEAIERGNLAQGAVWLTTATGLSLATSAVREEVESASRAPCLAEALRGVSCEHESTYVPVRA